MSAAREIATVFNGTCVRETVHNVHYADDLVACARTREEIEAAQSTIEEWLQPRGLTLHPEKTRIVHINDGFDFLGLNIRRYNGKCLCKPQKEKVLGFLADIRQWLNDHKAAAPENVIRHLNPIIRGWSDYYRHAVSSQTFAYAAHQIWMALWRWCLRRHPKKTKDWVRKKYFGLHQKGQWRFQASTRGKAGERKLYLFDIHSVRIERHAKVTGDASPDNPALREYWEKRKSRSPKQRAVTGTPQPRGKARAV